VKDEIDEQEQGVDYEVEDLIKLDKIEGK